MKPDPISPIPKLFIVNASRRVQLGSHILKHGSEVVVPAQGQQGRDSRALGRIGEAEGGGPALTIAAARVASPR